MDAFPRILMFTYRKCIGVRRIYPRSGADLLLFYQTYNRKASDGFLSFKDWIPLPTLRQWRKNTGKAKPGDIINVTGTEEHRPRIRNVR
jgi:hypothetical protein